MLDAIIVYLHNLAFVYGGVILFFAPFAGYFYWQHRAQIRHKKPHFNQFMELFFHSEASNWLVFFWAFAEALVWFMIPEFLLFLVIFMRVRRKRELLVYDIFGTALGTIVGLFVHWTPQTMLSVPYIFPGMVSHVRDWYEQMGVWALINQPFSGVPYKVFIAEVQYYAIPLGVFVVVAVTIRLLRYAMAYYIFILMYPVVHRLVYKHYAILFTLGIAVFTAMLMKVSGVYGGSL